MEGVILNFWPGDLIGKMVIISLVIASVYIWSFIIKKFITFLVITRAISAFKDYVLNMPKLKRLMVEDNSVHFQIYDALLNLYSNPYFEDNKFAKQEAIINESIAVAEYEMEKGLNYLSIIGSITPFVGLFGTVWGIMNSFQSIASCNSTSIAIVAPGISEALFATAVGLFVAIPATIATHLFYARIESVSKDARIFAMHVIHKLEERNRHDKQ